MNKSSFYGFILRFTPLMTIKDWGINHHMENYPRCFFELADQSEGSSLYLLEKPIHQPFIARNKKIVQEKIIPAKSTIKIKLHP